MPARSSGGVTATWLRRSVRPLTSVEAFAPGRAPPRVATRARGAREYNPAHSSPRFARSLPLSSKEDDMIRRTLISPLLSPSSRRSPARRSRRSDHLGVPRHARADVVRPGGDGGHHHAVHVPLRDARRAREVDARPAAWRRAWRSRGRSRPTASTYEFVLRKGVQVPQRRSRDRRGREVLLRALSWRRLRPVQGPRPRASTWSTRIGSASASSSRGPTS